MEHTIRPRIQLFSRLNPWLKKDFTVERGMFLFPAICSFCLRLVDSFIPILPLLRFSEIRVLEILPGTKCALSMEKKCKGMQSDGVVI